MVDIDVLDAGDGVSAGDVDRLKQPFVRGDHARGGAMGPDLGLAIVERLAKWHSGKLRPVAAFRRRAVARVRLPLARGR